MPIEGICRNNNEDKDKIKGEIKWGWKQE